LELKQKYWQKHKKEPKIFQINKNKQHFKQNSLKTKFQILSKQV
jgi:hypothetical protein